MYNKKRIVLMIFLLLFGICLTFITKKYEKNFISRENAEVVKNYSVFEKIKCYKKENRERYLRYYEKHKSLSYDDIVIRVNIGLDYGFYDYIGKTNIKKDTLMLTNKYLKLEEDYIPNDLEEIKKEYFINGNRDVRYLRKEAREAFEKLSSDSIKNNTPVFGQSAYRSYEKQKHLYDKAVNNYGKEKADLDTSRPGHSEHQTGLTIDVSSTKKGNMLSFENTNSFNWMKDNCYKYGFILRYPKNKEQIHGYIYEAWHYRYVGKKVAKDMHDNYSNLTFDEYYYKFIDKK